MPSRGQRRAVRVLDAILGEMKGAFEWGEKVDFPFGQMKRAKRHFIK